LRGGIHSQLATVFIERAITIGKRKMARGTRPKVKEPVSAPSSEQKFTDLR
jgi:hypothetical protein